MGIFSDLTKEQLIGATKTQVINKINDKLNAMSERRLKEFVWHIRDLIIEDLNYQEEVPVESQDCPNGQMLRIRKIRDLIGNKLGSQKFEWSYYPGQEGKRPVDIIIIIEMDANDEIISIKKIKHYLDGRQPEVIK